MRGLRPAVVMAAALVSSCVSYDLEPVEPVGLTYDGIPVGVVGTVPANVMLVIDKSGSMDLPMDSSVTACGSCGDSKSTLCPASCPTRWSELQGAMGSFLSSSGQIARFGLVTFPADAVCGAPGSVRVPLAAEDDPGKLSTHALQINAIIQGVSSAGASGTPNTTGGGTPIAAALRLLQAEPAFAPADRRSDVAVLLTDGLPNCNENNPNDWNADPAACRCTLGSCSALPRQGCLDDAATIDAIRALRARGVTVAVVGFGADATSGPAPGVLRDLARAGGFQRRCDTAADCATGDSCDPVSAEKKVCSTGLYLPGNRAQLASGLAEIARNPDVCNVKLAEPVDPSLIQVSVGGRRLEPGEYTLSDVDLAVIGAACRDLQAATPSSPVELVVVAIRPI